MTLPTVVDCDSLQDNITSEYDQDLWYNFNVYNSQMEAADMNALLWCIANSANKAVVGWDHYGFWNWEGLGTTLDPDIMDLLAEQAVQLLEFVLKEIRSLSSDE